jgi:putative mRNA 3-end processing factor
VAHAAALFPVELRPAGLYLPTLDLHLDPSEPVPRAFVSHAHALGPGPLPPGGGLVLASQQTLALAAALGRDVSGARPLGWSTPLELGAARVSIEPAGHLFGAAQLVVEHARGRWVYTGDFCAEPGHTHAAGAAVACDELLTAAAFGLPIFRFPERALTADAIVAFCRQALGEGHTPVLLAQPLGEAMELLHVLLEAGLALDAEESVFRIAEAYERLGVDLGVADGRLRRASPVPAPKADAAEPRTLVASPAAHRLVRKVRGARVALASGLALIDAASEQRRADAAFVFSELSDHDQLVAMVRATGARHVTTTHGYASAFARVLLDMGLSASALEHGPLDAARRHVRGGAAAWSTQEGGAP